MKNKIQNLSSAWLPSLGRLLVVLAILVAFVPGNASAQYNTNLWTGGANGAWLTPGNWSPSGPPAGTNVLRFTNTTTTSVGLNLNSSNTITAGSFLMVANGNLTFSNSSTGAAGVNGRLVISGTTNTGSTPNMVVVESSSGVLRFTNNISGTNYMNVDLATTGIMNASNTGSIIEIGSALRETNGTQGFIKTGAGTLILNGTNANTFAGAAVVTDGSLLLAKSAGTTAILSNLTVSNGTVLFGNSNQIANGASVILAGGTINMSNHSDTVGSYTQSGGNFTNGTITASTYTLSGGTMNGTLGAGALTASNNATINGTANTTTAHVTNGTLTVNGTLNGTTTVDATGILKGTGDLNNLIVSGTLAPGNSIGEISAGNTVFNGGGAFNLEMYDWTGSGGTAWDLLSITGNLTLSNTIGSPFTINLISMSSTNTAGNSINFNPVLSFTNTFITYTGSLLGETFSSSLFTVNTGSFSNTFTGTFSITNIAGGLALVYTAPSGDSDYNWDVTSGDWSNGSNWTNNAAPTNGASIVFSGVGGLSTNNEVSDVAGITFVEDAGEYLVSGDALTIGAFGVVNESTNAQVIDLDVTLGSSQNFSAQEGNLAFFGGVDLAAYSLSVNGAKDTLITGDVTGSGALIKSGAGTLVLTGNNNYSGGTTVSGGRLVGDTDSIQGNVLNNAAVTLDQDANGTYAGNMTGSGSLLKDGVGTVTLSGTNSYGGGTEVANGGIIGTTDSVQGDILNDGTVAFNQSANGTYAGDMSGSGSLTKAGSGTVTLSGTNSYGGGTTVAAGGLVGTTSSIQGDIDNDGTVTFTQAGNGTYAGDMSGSGSLHKTGTNTLFLTGSNSYTGGTEVAGGGLTGTTASVQGDITNNGVVTFDQASNGTYSGDMSGTGSVVKSDVGTVTLTGSNSYAGGTTVLDGGSLIAASDTALGTGTVTIGEGSVFAQDGVVVDNDFVIGTASVNETNYGSVTAIAGWDVNGLSTGATSAPGTGATGVTVGTMTLGSGVGTGAVANALGGNNWDDASAAAAVASGSFMTFSVAATSNNTVLKFTTLDPFYYRSSSTGPTNATLQYSLDGGTNFSDLVSTNGFTRNTTTGTYGSMDITLEGVGTNGALFRWVVYGATADTGTWYLRNGNASGNDLVLNGQIGTITNSVASGSGTIGIDEAGLAIFTGNIVANNNVTLHAAEDGIADFSGVISGVGTIEKTGEGLVMFDGSEANTQTGKITVSAGILQLAKDADTQAVGGDVEVMTDAILFISSNEQVSDTSEITLSGGTILRGEGVSETFGDLVLTASSTLAYGGHEESIFLQFGTVFLDDNTLTVDSFLLGNQLRYLADDYAAGLALADLLNFTNSHTDFIYSFDSGTFTITSIPEPSTYAAAAGLLGMMLWPARRRIVHNTKRILGLRTPRRDRLARRGDD